MHAVTLEVEVKPQLAAWIGFLLSDPGRDKYFRLGSDMRHLIIGMAPLAIGHLIDAGLENYTALGTVLRGTVFHHEPECTVFYRFEDVASGEIATLGGLGRASESLITPHGEGGKDWLMSEPRHDICSLYFQITGPYSVEVYPDPEMVAALEPNAGDEPDYVNPLAYDGNHW